MFELDIYLLSFLSGMSARCYLSLYACYVESIYSLFFVGYKEPICALWPLLVASSLHDLIPILERDQ